MKISLQKICKHRSYTIKEISDLLGITGRQCSRWIEGGLLIVSGCKNPILISGNDLKEFLKNRRLKKKITIGRYQFLCMHCKRASDAKRGTIKMIGNRKTALCRVCNGKMSKTIKPHQNDYMIHAPPT
jgi:hypothetical protein